MLRQVRIGAASTDLRMEGDRIAAIGAGVRRSRGDDELDAGHGTVLPGLHDHHLHLWAWVAAGRSVVVGPPRVRDRAGLAAALAAGAARLPAGEWIRAVGYHPSVAGDLDRDLLDRLVADRPVRVQHRSGVLWVCNSAGLAALDAARESAPGIERDAAGRLTGRLWRMDGWLAERLAPLGEAGPARPRDLGDLARLSAAAAAMGVTGWTDATPQRSDPDTDALLEAAASGAVSQRLHLMLPAGAPASTAARVEAAGATAGPVKILLDDPDLPALDALAGLMAGAHQQGRAVAVHCVTRVQLLLTLAALDAAGPFPGDRIEHGAVIPVEVLPTIAGLGLTVVTQPNFVAERGDEYLADVPSADWPDLWRARSLVDAGIPVAAGTDAPFGSPDPWAAIRAAVRRQAPSGRTVEAREAVALPTALAWWWGAGPSPATPRRLQPGQPADLVVLARPGADALEGESPVQVRATIIAGRLVFAGEGG